MSNDEVTAERNITARRKAFGKSGNGNAGGRRQKRFKERRK
jgi:hypothetical protein